MPEVWVVCSAAARVGMKAAMVEAKAWTPEQQEVQDALVRRSDPCVVVQGLPGTGKTASVMPPLPDTMTSEGGSSRSPKRLKVDSEKIVWWNSGIANPDMFSVHMLPGSVHNCSRIIFEGITPTLQIHSCAACSDHTPAHRARSSRHRQSDTGGSPVGVTSQRSSFWGHSDRGGELCRLLSHTTRSL